MKDPSSGNEAPCANASSIELARLLVSLNPDDKRKIAGQMRHMAKACETSKHANALYRMADLVTGYAADEERAAQALGLEPGEGLA